MYRDILTMCWSIKEVNKNLSDRKATADYSIKYLKDACAELARQIRDVSESRADEKIEVVDKAGITRSLSLKEVSEMLYDARKIMELNLIDNIDRWARVQNSQMEVRSKA
jgi:hypothetical protein